VYVYGSGVFNLWNRDGKNHRVILLDYWDIYLIDVILISVQYKSGVQLLVLQCYLFSGQNSLLSSVLTCPESSSLFAALEI